MQSPFSGIFFFGPAKRDATRWDLLIFRLGKIEEEAMREKKPQETRRFLRLSECDV